MVTAADTFSMKVNLFISGRKLRDLDTFSKSDPQCLLFEKKNNNWVKVGSTEQIKNSLNPDFRTSLTMPYFFEKQQNMRICIIDGDGAGDYEEIGDVECTMGQLMGARAQTWTGNLQHKGSGNRGQVIVRTEAVKESNEWAQFDVRADQVNNLGGGCLGMCAEPMRYKLEIQKQAPGSDVYVTSWSSQQTQLRQGWVEKHQIPLSQICNADKNASIRFAFSFTETAEVFNTFTTSIQQLESGQCSIDGQAGTRLILDNFRVFVRPSFIDYLRAGWQISLVGAVDYTASNEVPRLHAIGQQMNQYQSALLNVGSIVEPYDYDKMFPVFGFGGIPRHMNNNSVSHCFAMNGNAANPNIAGVQGILQTYQETLPSIGLGGPTLFAPLLQEFMNFTNSVIANRTYPVLLLLTDGIIHDMPETKNLVYALSSMPCSIIIVGVGPADFSAMEELDGDGGRLRNTSGQACARDIVQFVRYSDAIARGNLAEQVLKEVPNQLVSYMEMKGESSQAVQHDMQMQQ